MAEWIFAGVITALGWFASYYFARLQDDRTRRLELRIKQLQRQIEEFYGPLFNLVNEIDVSKQVLEAIAGGDTEKLSQDAKVQVKVFVRENHMKPIHDEIIELLHTKMYLIDTVDVPASFREYLHHAFQERLQREIWTQLQIATVHVQGTPFPQQFKLDVQNGLQAVLQKYEDALAELEPRKRRRVRRQLPAEVANR